MLVLGNFHWSFFPCWTQSTWRTGGIAFSHSQAPPPTSQTLQGHEHISKGTLGNFPLSLGRAGFYHSLFPEQSCRGNESRYENQLLSASNTTPNPSLDRFPVPQEGQAEKFLLSAPQLPFSPPFPKEALGLLLPMLPPPWQLLNSSLVPGEGKTNIRRALMYSSCQWTHTAPAEAGTQPPRFGVCYNEWSHTTETGPSHHRKHLILMLVMSHISTSSLGINSTLLFSHCAEASSSSTVFLKTSWTPALPIFYC